jgi:hypothetical protein
MLNAKMLPIVVPPQKHPWHCILVSALSLSNAVVYSECHYANAILVNVIMLSAAFLFCFVMSSLFAMNVKILHIVAPPQMHAWHCILV